MLMGSSKKLKLGKQSKQSLPVNPLLHSPQLPVSSSHLRMGRVSLKKLKSLFVPYRLQSHAFRIEHETYVRVKKLIL